MQSTLENIHLNFERITPSQTSSETVLLFLHEALGSIGQWKDYPQMLCDATGMQGLVYERQGHGASTPLTEKRNQHYLHNYALQELPSFLEQFDHDFILVGHSDGGTIALLYATQYPDRIKGIITMAAHMMNEPETVAGIDPAVKAYEEGKLNGLVKYHGEKTEDLFFAWANTWRAHFFANWNIEAEIGHDSIPGFFIQGKDDQYGTDEQIKRICKRFPNNKSLLVEGCGHHPHLECKEEMIALQSEWIESIR